MTSLTLLLQFRFTRMRRSRASLFLRTTRCATVFIISQSFRRRSSRAPRRRDRNKHNSLAVLICVGIKPCCSQRRENEHPISKIHNQSDSTERDLDRTISSVSSSTVVRKQSDVQCPVRLRLRREETYSGQV